MKNVLNIESQILYSKITLELEFQTLVANLEYPEWVQALIVRKNRENILGYITSSPRTREWIQTSWNQSLASEATGCCLSSEDEELVGEDSDATDETRFQDWVQWFDPWVIGIEKWLFMCRREHA
jgi:hypothetical protein